MADSNKKEKIAAAKKKLKQFKRGRSVSKTRDSSDRELPRGHANSLSPNSTSPIPPEAAVYNDTTENNVNGTTSPVPPLDDNRTTASTESLQQLSRQINGLISESQTPNESAAYLNGVEPASNGLQELEDRNRDLAALLEKHVQANEQLNIQNHQLRDHSKALQDQLEGERISFYEKQKKDIGSLKEQLQVHIQTIGILVAEKTELQSQVNQSQRIADQRIEEIEEYSGRLKASRQRVADLERSLSATSQSSQQLEKNHAENSKELDKFKLEAYKFSKQNEELKQQVSELTEQLQAKITEGQSSSQDITELQKKLEMAELYAQQLSSENENSQGSVEVLTSLQKERDSLVSRLHQHEELAQKLQTERDQVTEQYQQYTEQLRHQSQQLAQQVTVLTEEREQLLNKQHDLEGAVHELQRKLEDLDNAPKPEVSVAPQVPSIPPEMTSELERLRTDVQEAAIALETQVRDNMQLSRLLEEKEERIMNLERSVEEMGEQEGDKASLLESIQSDKTALSRALTQNKDLKTQLEELQQGFVKISTDNAELVTKLQTEEHSTFELLTRLNQQEVEMSKVRDQLATKEGEVSELESACESVEKEMYQQDQMKDRLRHYEAQAQLVDTLQNELTSAQDMMEALTTQNSELRTMLIKATEVKSPTADDVDNGSGEPNGRNEVIESLQATISQLESERSHLYESLKEQRKLSDNLGIKIADLQEEVIRKTEDNNPDSERISRSEYTELKTAMEMITQKYMHVMQDKAELSDKADQLEHLVLQLQGESDTIGEYISLYHHQRALLQQRETQKNDYIAQLARDRQQLQDKLGELQVLVMQMLGERNMLHSYTEETAIHRTQSELSNTPGRQLTNGYEHDWPDYTSSDSDTDSEVEPIVGGQPEDSDLTPQSSPTESPRGEMEHPAHRSSVYGDHILQENGLPDVDMEQKHSHHLHSHHHNNHHHHTDNVSKSFNKPPEDDRTAHKILSLLTELGHSHMVDQVPLIDRNFLPCKFCKGAVQIV